MEKGLTMRGGQTPVQRFWKILLAKVRFAMSCTHARCSAKCSVDHAVRWILHITQGCTTHQRVHNAAHHTWQVETGELDPSIVVTHVLPGLSQASAAYKMFDSKQPEDRCIKVGR